MNNEIIKLSNRIGLSLIPIAEKDKKPHRILGKKHDLLKRRATDEELEKYINAGVKSWAVAGGAVSGNLMCLDFDEKHYEGLFERWYDKLSEEHKNMIADCPIVQTRNNGKHVRYRTPSAQPTEKLARKVINGKIETTAETRGEGSYALIPPSEGYKLLSGSLERLPFFSNETHKEFLDVLRTFNEVHDQPTPEYEWTPPNNYTSERPGDRLNTNSSWKEILEPHGWIQDSKNQWRRPGKKAGEGISATTDYDGRPMFYVFSSAASPFKANKGYSKFHVFALLNHNGDFKEAAKSAAKKYPLVQDTLDPTKFKEITMEEICRILDATIKMDTANKSITFLSMVTTYTDDAQMNVFFNAPSSTGKSHIPLCVVEIFPDEDKIILSHCSPTAFFHEQGVNDSDKNEITVDLSRKILIFTDMPNTGLLERLRSILSHDTKKSQSKITDKNQKGGNRTKTVTIIGYPSVYFCSAGLRVDEQESTRFIMLSPSVEHDKIIQGIKQSIAKESDREKFLANLDQDPARTLLKERILSIKHEHVIDVKIENQKLVESLFLTNEQTIQPRLQRDIKKVISLIKGFTLINLWFRKHSNGYVFATDDDIKNGFTLWQDVSFGQEYGIAPYVMNIYTKVIIPLWEESGLFGKSDKQPVTRKQIIERHFKLYKRPLSMTYVRQHILPQLESVGLIVQERSNSDSREMVVIPLETNLGDVCLPEVKVEI